MQVAGEVAGLGVDGLAAGGHVARAEAVGDLVLLQEAGEALDFALIGRGDEDAGVLADEALEGFDERGDAAVEALRGAGGEVDFGEIAAVGVEDVDCAELVEFDAGEGAQAVVEIPGRDVDVLGADEGADAGALVPLLDLVPPALALVLDHGGLFDEDAGGGAEQIEQSERCAPATGAKNSQPGKMVASPVRVADVGAEFGGLFAAFEFALRRGRRG